MQPTADFLVPCSNPGWANMAAAALMTDDRQGFEPPTKKTAADCVTIGPCFVATVQRIPTAWSLLTKNIMPWDDSWDDNLGLFYAIPDASIRFSGRLRTPPKQTLPNHTMVVPSHLLHKNKNCPMVSLILPTALQTDPIGV